MIRLRDTVQSRSTPIITWLIIIVSTVVFLYEARLPAINLANFIDVYGLTPSGLDIFSPPTWTPLATPCS